MTTRIETLNQMILKYGLEELSAEYQGYWGEERPGHKRGHEKNPPGETPMGSRVIFLIGYSVTSFGLLYLLAVLFHYMMETP